MRRRCGESNSDERAPNQRVRAGDGWVRGGGQPGPVRGCDVDRGADEQNERADWRLAHDRRWDLRV